MSYKTVEVELQDGRVTPRGDDALPAKARALLTILHTEGNQSRSSQNATDAGLRRFLSAPCLPLTPEQFRASMETDFFDQ